MSSSRAHHHKVKVMKLIQKLRSLRHLLDKFAAAMLGETSKGSILFFAYTKVWRAVPGAKCQTLS